MIAFTVVGVASGMGSKRAFIPKGWKRAIITDSNRNLRSWQSLVADAAGRAVTERGDAWCVLDGAVRLSLAFYLPRPKSLSKKVTAHIKKPDCSKLIRATEDALTGIIFLDDAQVVELVAGKYYTGTGDAPHVRIRVEPTSAIVPVVVPPASLPLFDPGATS